MEEQTITVRGHEVEVDDGGVEGRAAKQFAGFVTEAARYDALCRAAIAKDSLDDDDDGATRVYFEFALEHMPERAAALGVEDVASPGPAALARFVEQLYLRQIWANDDDGTLTVMFDYTIDHQALDHVVCVGFDAKGRITGVELES